MISVSSRVTYADYMNALSSGAEYHVQILPYGVTGVSPLTEVDIESSGFQISDILNGDERLIPGRAVMKELSINFLPTAKVQNFDWNMEFILRVMVKVGTRWESTTLGQFRGTRPEKVHNTDVIHFKAYDLMQNFDIPAEPFMQSLAWPMTLEDFTKKLCAYCGVNYVNSADALPNVWGRSFDSGFSAEGLTCRDLLALAAEACGCYATIGNTGIMTLKWFHEVDPENYAVIADREFTVDAMDVPSATTWEQMAELTWEEASHRTWGSFAGWQTLFAYDGLNVRQTEDDVGVSYGGLTGNVLTIVDNPFLAIREDGDGETYVKPLWERLQGFGGYLPMSVECVGNWLVEAGDIIQVDVSGETIMMPIFNRTMTFNGACADRYEATGTLEKQAFSSNGAREKLTQGAKFHVFRVDIDTLISRIGDAEGNIASVKQQADEIELEVADKYEKVSGITITALGIDVSGNQYVKIATGGVFKVDSNNFKIDSETGEMISGPWAFDANGATHTKLLESYNKNVMFNIGRTPESWAASDEVAGLFTEWAYKNNLPCPTIWFYVTRDQSKSIYDVFVPKFPMSFDPTENAIYIGEAQNTDYSSSDVPLAEFYGSFYPRLIGSTAIGYVGQENGRRFAEGAIDQLYTNVLMNSLDSSSGSGRQIKSLLLYPVKYSSECVKISEETESGEPYCLIESGYSGNGKLRINADLIRVATLRANYLQNYSSREVKHDIQPLEDMGAKIDRLAPVSFIYNSDEEGRKRFGLIQEDTAKVMPEICSGDENSKPEERSINYVDLVPVLLKEIQELRKRVSGLESRVAELERR